MSVLAAAVLGDHGAWWVLGVALLAGPQVMAVVVASRRRMPGGR